MRKVSLIRERFFSGYRLDKKINEYVVLDLIRKKGPISIPNIVRITNLSRPTIDSFINHLQRRDFIKIEGLGSSRGGRKSNLWKINNKAGYIVGIDMESPHLTILLTDLELNVIGMSKTTFSLSAKKEKILDLLKTKNREIFTKSGISQTKLVGIGIGVPGLIDKSRGTSVSIERIPDWRDVPLVQILKEEFKVSVFLENDVTLMSIAEKTLNKEIRNKENMIYIGFRTGIGGGIFINGKLFNGVYGNTGFIGHTTVEKEGPRCRCGNKGCLELFADEPAIINKAKEGTKRGTKTNISQLAAKKADAITIEIILQAAREGDVFARSILREAAEYLGLGIANVVNLLDIPLVIIGGSITKAGELFLEWVREASRKRLTSIYRDYLDLRYAKIDQNTAALGGAICVLQDIFKEPSILIDRIAEIKLKTEKRNMNTTIVRSLASGKLRRWPEGGEEMIGPIS